MVKQEIKREKNTRSPARAQAFSWLTSVTSLQFKRDKITVQSTALYKLRQ